MVEYGPLETHIFNLHDMSSYNLTNVSNLHLTNISNLPDYSEDSYNFLYQYRDPDKTKRIRLNYVQWMNMIQLRTISSTGMSRPLKEIRYPDRFGFRP